MGDFSSSFTTDLNSRKHKLLELLTHSLALNKTETILKAINEDIDRIE